MDASIKAGKIILVFDFGQSWGDWDQFSRHRVGNGEEEAEQYGITTSSFLFGADLHLHLSSFLLKMRKHISSQLAENEQS